MKRTTVVVLAVLALLGVAAGSLLAAGCGGEGGEVSSDEVATVGDGSVTKADFDKLLTQAKTQVEAQGSTFPKQGSPAYDQYVGQIVNYLVQEQIVAQSAGDLGVTVSDKEVDDQIAQIKKDYGGEKKVLALLKEQGMTMELLQRSLRSQALTQKVAAAVVKKASVSDADVRAYWDAHKAQLSKKQATATLPRPPPRSARHCSARRSSRSGRPGSSSGPRRWGSCTPRATTPRSCCPRPRRRPPGAAAADGACGPAAAARPTLRTRDGAGPP